MLANAMRIVEVHQHLMIWGSLDMRCYAMPCLATPCYAKLINKMLCYTILSEAKVHMGRACEATLCYTLSYDALCLLCYVMLIYVKLCYVMLS